MKNIIKLSLIVMIVSILLIQVGSATTYYVRTDGNNSNTGLANDSTTALLTVQKCTSILIAGDICRVQNGTYQEQNISFTNNGSIISGIYLIGDNNPKINGTNTIFIINRSYINISFIYINSTTGFIVKNLFSTGSMSPVINITNVEGIVLLNNSINQWGFGNFAMNQPENAGYGLLDTSIDAYLINQPDVLLWNVSNSSVLSNTLFAQNINSAGVHIYASTGNNISNNIIDTRHSYSIYIHPTSTSTKINFNHTISGNIGYNKLPIYYVFNTTKTLVSGQYDEILCAYCVEPNISDINMNNSDGILLYWGTNPIINNFTSIKTKVPTYIAGTYYDGDSGTYKNWIGIKQVLLSPVRAYNTQNVSISNFYVNNSGRHITGVYFNYITGTSNISNFTYSTYEGFYETGGGSGHNQPFTFANSQDITTTNFTGNVTLSTDYSGYLTNTDRIWFNNMNLVTSNNGGFSVSGEGTTHWHNVTINDSQAYALSSKDSSVGKYLFANDSIIDGCWLGTCTDGKVILVWGGTAYLLNVTYNRSNLYAYSPTTGTLYRQWRAYPQITDGTTPISEALVNITDNFSNLIYSGTTDSNGRIPQQILQQYKQNGTNLANFINQSPYWINVSKSGYNSNFTLYNITSNFNNQIILTLSSNQTLDNDISLFWVRIDGNDSCNGQNNMSYGFGSNQNLTDCAWQTVNMSAQTLVAGQTANVLSGVYNENVTVKNSGTNSSNWITLKTINGNVTLDGGYLKDNGLLLSGISFFNLSGVFIIQNFTTSGINMAMSNNYINLTGTVIQNIIGSGITQFNSIFSNMVFDGITVKNASTYAINLNVVTGGISKWGNNTTVKNSYIYNGRHDCIDIHGDSGSQIQDINIINNYLNDCTGGYGIAVHNGDFATGVYLKRINITGNTMENVSRGVMFLGVNDSIFQDNNINNSYNTFGIYIDREQGFPGVHNLTIKNNTVTNSASEDVLIYPTTGNAIDTISNISFISNNFTHLSKTYFFYGDTKNITGISITNQSNPTFYISATNNIINGLIINYTNTSTQFKWKNNSDTAWNYVIGTTSITNPASSPVTVSTSSLDIGFLSKVPTSPVVTSNLSVTQTFSAETNITANYSWKINGTEVQTNNSISSASYTNSTAGIDTYNVTLDVSNIGGYLNSTKWTWTVTSNSIYSVSGYVNDTLGLSQINVLVTNGTNQSTTNSAGYYQITGMINGTYNFTYTKAGYVTGYKNVTINGANIINQNITLISLLNITSWGNDYTNNNTLNITVPSGTTVMFNATSNYNVDTWTWTGASLVAGGMANTSSANKIFNSIGTYYITVTCSNVNGSCINTVNWTIIVTPVINITISCPTGWCFLAMNYTTGKTLLQLDNIFTTINTDGWYNSTSQKYETHYHNFIPNQNANVPEKWGYYYYFNSPISVQINITENPSINLTQGWNLVGNLDSNRTLSTLKTSIGAEATQAKHFNYTSQNWQSADSENVQVGESFFVYVTANKTWSG